MTNKLIVLAHSDYENSKANKALAKAVEVGGVEVHNLNQKYPDAHFDVTAEQAKLESANEIIFQFPMNWFSTPWIFKKYLDEVFTYGWAYGSAYKLEGKHVKLAITAGVNKAGYDSGLSVADALKWLKVTLAYCRLDFKDEIFVVYGTMGLKDEELAVKAKEYVKFIG
ncbi:MAG: NAD(P)H-dependent oxidoreductase [Mangrovibacterium sp.]